MDKSQLLKNIEEMELKLADMKKELEEEEKHFPQKGDKYYFIDQYGTLNYQVAQDNNGRFQVFKTEEEAQKFYEVECARQRVKDEIKKLNDGWTPNWTNINESKNYIRLIGDKLNINSYNGFKDLDNSMYLKNRILANELINSHKDDLLLILGQ